VAQIEQAVHLGQMAVQAAGGKAGDGTFPSSGDPSPVP
jgi:hypothetical protein